MLIPQHHDPDWGIRHIVSGDHRPDRDEWWMKVKTCFTIKWIHVKFFMFYVFLWWHFFPLNGPLRSFTITFLLWKTRSQNKLRKNILSCPHALCDRKSSKRCNNAKHIYCKIKIITMSCNDPNNSSFFMIDISFPNIYFHLIYLWPSWKHLYVCMRGFVHLVFTLQHLWAFQFTFLTLALYP